MHDAICETTKLASSIENICKFEIDDFQFGDSHFVWNGSFSYDSNEINFRKNVKCFQLVQQRGSIFNAKFFFDWGNKFWKFQEYYILKLHPISNINFNPDKSAFLSKTSSLYL